MNVVYEAACGAFGAVVGTLNITIGGPVARILGLVSEASGLPVSQISFLTSVVLNCPLAAATRLVPKGVARHAYGALTTISLLTLAYGRDAQQFVLAAGFVYGLMWLFPRDCGYCTWATIFTYQIYLHYERASEEAWNQGSIDFTGSFMMLTLKLISVAMDYQDGSRRLHFKGKATDHAIYSLPSPMEFCGYLFGLGGTLVGPQWYYDEYIRYANGLGEYERMGTSDFPGPAGPAAKALMASAFSTALYFQLGSVITDRPAIVTMNDGSIGVWGKLLIGFFANLQYRLKLYFAWHLEEAALILSGFGYSGRSKHDGQTAVWTKAVSAAMIECEAPPSVALAAVKWNRHTGLWLRNYVYNRIPAGGLTALLVTQTICGLWHGLSPSFILFFGHTALLIQASRVLYKIQTRRLPASTLPYTNFAHSLWTTFSLSYIAGSYNVVSWESAIDWWSSIRFCGHYAIAGIFALGFMYKTL